MATPRHPILNSTESLAVRWGNQVAERRELLGLTRNELARIAEMTPQAIWLFETGRRIPLDRTKVVLARALGTTPPQLFPWPSMDELAGMDAAA